MINIKKYNKQKSPVYEGQIVTGNIIALGEKGDGIMKINNYVIFVPGVAMGEEVEVKITRTLDKCGFAELINTVVDNGSH